MFQYLMFCLLLDVGEEVYDDVDASDFPPPPAEMRSLKHFLYTEVWTRRLEHYCPGLNLEGGVGVRGDVVWALLSLSKAVPISDHSSHLTAMFVSKLS